MMTQPSISELAKQGNPNAIASLITRSLSPQGITAKASLKGNCLRVMLESLQVPDQEKTVQFIHKNLTKLKIKSIKTVKIYGKQVEQDFPAWSNDFDLESQVSVEAKLPDFSDSIGVASEPSQKNCDSEAKLKDVSVLKRISQVLMGSLGLRISFDSLFVIYAIVWASSYYIYNIVDVADVTGILAYLIRILFTAVDSLWNPLEFTTIWVDRIAILIILVWLHRLHASLRTIFSEYPITPWGAIARFAIPFYSFWGIWNVLATLANCLKSQEGELARRGASLLRWLPWLYLSLITSNLLNQIYLLQLRHASQDDYSPWFFVVKNSASLFLSIVWLQIVRIISKAIAQAVNNNSKVLSAPLVEVGKLPVKSPKSFSIKAVIYGLLLDIIGTNAASFLIGIVTTTISAIAGTRPDDLTAPFSSSGSLFGVSLVIGLLFTMSGGFLTAHIAKKLELKHAFVMGSLSAFISLIVGSAQVQNEYQAMALLLTIPAALLGGYFRRISRKS